MIHLILLSGGSGTRLWPLSNDSRSKQFLKVLRDAEGNHVSMVQRVFAQINRVDADVDITIATCEAQRDSIMRQLSGDYALVLEPKRRDTAPAIMLAGAHLRYEQKAALDDVVVVMPIDTYADQEYYDRIPKLAEAVEGTSSQLVLLGVKPSYPSEKYGYIIPAACEGDLWPVAEFKEKPDAATAQQFIDQGGLWNCGVFAFKLGYLMKTLGRYMNAKSFHDVYARYSHLPRNSFDYEVVEKAKSISVMTYEGVWKDLGTWNMLTEEMAEPFSGRVVVDGSTCQNVHVINETGLPMVVAGMSDAVIIATPDGILVTGKEASDNIKVQVASAAELRPMYEHRRWGEYRVIDSSVFGDGRHALTKELIIEPMGQLSYQKHFHRSEVWTIVSGRGEVAIDGEVQEVGPGDVVNIAVKRLHAARALTEMHVIEVQIGDKLIEEDIERFGDFWNE